MATRRTEIDFKSDKERDVWDRLVVSGHNSRSVSAATIRADDIILARRRRSERMEEIAREVERSAPRALERSLLVEFANCCAGDANEHVIHSWVNGASTANDPTVCGRKPTSRILVPAGIDLSKRASRTFTVEGVERLFDLCPDCVVKIRG
jgi:hypothetical protein